jgi:deazaflavin-dependent oxidoreductase (nitroreductase family)
MAFGADAADHDYCYLTTTGRVSGKPREIEIWFALETVDPRQSAARLLGRAARVFMLSGGGERSDWVRNLQREAAVTVRIGGVTRPGRARLVEDPDEDALARRLLFDKYSGRYSGDLENWRRTARPVAVDFTDS